MKKLLALVLAILLVVSAVLLVSCGDDKDESKDNDKTQSTEASKTEASSEKSEESEEEKEKTRADILAEHEKWNTTLKLVSQISSGNKYHPFEMWADETSEDVVQDAIYTRSRLIEKEYGITIQVEFTDSKSDTANTVNKIIQNAIMGDQVIDLVADNVMSVAEGALDDQYYDLRQLNAEYNDGKGWLDLSASYWDQTAMRDLSMGNRLFFLTGDACISDDQATWCMLFNKQMIEDRGLESPYDLVENKEWTLDKLYEMVKFHDSGTGSADYSYKPEDGDTWGLLSQTYDGLMFMLGCGQTMVEKNEDDLPVLRVTDETNVNIWNKVFEIMTDNYTGVADFYGRWNDTPSVYKLEGQIFTNGNALFMPCAVSSLMEENFSNSDVDYGIIPMPMASELQDDYSSSATVYHFRVLAIPKCQGNLECALFTLEALAYHGQEIVTPAYYELVLKGQKTKDARAEDMLDLIFRNRTYDMSICYNFGNMIQFYTTILGSRNSGASIASMFGSLGDSYQAAIDDAVDTFNSLTND